MELHVFQREEEKAGDYAVRVPNVGRLSNPSKLSSSQAFCSLRPCRSLKPSLDLAVCW